jgi:ubiquinone/menaquinone biosynthesis C-methylase UbiE
MSAIKRLTTCSTISSIFQEQALINYYNARTYHMEDVYRIRHRGVEENPAMVKAMHASLTGRRVLDVAAGTGHWTTVAAAVGVHESSSSS